MNSIGCSSSSNGPSSAMPSSSADCSADRSLPSSSSVIFQQFTIDQRHFVHEDYFSLESIFATNTNICCTFESKTPPALFPLLGRKAPEVISEKGYRANVPAWLVPAVDHICSFAVPTVYNSVNRDVIHAGAQSVNLEQLQRHYYTLGTFICRLVPGEQARHIALALLSAFTQRIGRIVRDCTNTGAKPTRLDETEKRIFWTMQRTEHRKGLWMGNRREDEGRHRRAAKRKHCGGISTLLSVKNC
ncbi:hypothetical protein niasHT_009467 [Heterodera trifolii]|uniref:DNA replication complex GINS protein PSF3 n=1 Tax=Heterodera trifolii TaxID=157864 RepID=A0ABD2MF76_9BILA